MIRSKKPLTQTETQALNLNFDDDVDKQLYRKEKNKKEILKFIPNEPKNIQEIKQKYFLGSITR